MLRVTSIRALILLAIVALAVGSCSGYKAEHEAEQAEQLGNWDEAGLKYLELNQKDPANLTYRAALLRAKIQASHHHFELGGWNETKVVIRFWIIALIFALLALATLKLR